MAAYHIIYNVPWYTLKKVSSKDSFQIWYTVPISSCKKMCLARFIFLNFFPLPQLSMLETQLKGAEEERDGLRRDLRQTNLGRDDLVRKAWEARDAAVGRKNAAEVELARERIGIMQVRSERERRVGWGEELYGGLPIVD